jgi:hypothetical protein
MSPPPLDFLALALLVLMALAAILMRLRSAGEDVAATSKRPSADPFYRHDPVWLPLPLTGLKDAWPQQKDYLPEDIERLLAQDTPAAPVDEDAAGLETALQPQPQTFASVGVARLSWLLTLSLVLLALFFLLLRLLMAV